MAKKSGTAIRDFFISLGFDASDVEKGFKQIEKEFSKLQKTLNGTMTANVKVQQQQNKVQKETVKHSNANVASEKESVSHSKARVASERQLYTLEKARAELKRKIAYIEKQEKALGVYVPNYYKDQKNAARSKNLDRIKLESDKLNETYKVYLDLEKKLDKQKRDQEIAAKGEEKARRAYLQRYSDAQTALAQFKEKTLAENKKALDQQRKDAKAAIDARVRDEEKAIQRVRATEDKVRKAKRAQDRMDGLARKRRIDADRKRAADDRKLGESQYSARRRLAKENIKARIRADKARIKEQERLEKDSLNSLNRQRQNALKDNLKALRKFRKTTIREQMIEDKRWVVEDRVNLISRRADWMMQRQGGMAKGLSKTEEHKDYTDGLTGVRKMASTARTESDFKRLDRAIASLNLSYNQLIVKNKELQREFRVSAFTAKALQDSLRNLARSYVSVFAVIGGTGMAAATGQDLVALRTTLLAATGSAEEAGKAFEFVKETSLGMGLDLQSATRGFAQMGVAAKMAGLSGDQTKEIFTGLAEATAAFGMNTVDAERALRAITQMMNKGQVYAEELKQQLGESLPAAIPLAAKAMGVAPQELYKMMERGELVASEFLPKFTKTLREAVREGNALGEGLNTSRVAMARFGTSFKLNILGAFDAGTEGGLAEFFNSLTDATEQSAPLFNSLGKIVGILAATLGTLLLAGKQLVRPFYSFFDAIVGGSKDASKEVGILTKLFAALGYAILTPFVWLERMNNQLEKTSTLSKALAAGIGIMVTVVSSRISLMLLSMVGLNARLASFVSGWGMLSKVFGLLSRHPFIRMLLAIFTAAEAIDSVTESETYAKEKQRLVNDYSKDGELAWYEKLTASAMAFQYSAHTEVAGGIRSIIDWFKAEKVGPKQIINNIYSNSSDPEEVARAVVRQQQQAEYQTNMR